MLALTALLSGKSVSEAAKLASVHETTIRRWLRTDESFMEALSAGRREALWAAMDVTATAARLAADTVVSILKNTKVRPQVRLAAAKIIFDSLTRWLELQDFDRRLRKLEGTDHETE